MESQRQADETKERKENKASRERRTTKRSINQPESSHQHDWGKKKIILRGPCLSFG